MVDNIREHVNGLCEKIYDCLLLLAVTVLKVGDYVHSITFSVHKNVCR